MKTKELPLYNYSDENDLIYELDDEDIYYPIILAISAEKNCSSSVKARTKLEHMKEHDLAYYVELVKQDKLNDHILKYLSQLKELTNQIFSGMEIQDEMGRMMAEEIARDRLL
ncbi:TnpV protein [Vallitalea guaymasensis]|uniref:TnpV protein n=1 Tax=Vallitalea guaymasensis TaxID=1185412 RepID=A0A8J8SAN9_9FIRM|nr:TnpV protein [Vallitalea guaymasensis]QUH27565.1 TnpV protein [Vallitalea guaymasensis]